MTEFTQSDYERVFEILAKLREASDRMDEISLPTPDADRRELWSLGRELDRVRDHLGLFVSAHPWQDVCRYRTRLGELISVKDAIAESLGMGGGTVHMAHSAALIRALRIESADFESVDGGLQFYGIVPDGDDELEWVIAVSDRPTIIESPFEEEDFIRPLLAMAFARQGVVRVGQTEYSIAEGWYIPAGGVIRSLRGADYDACPDLPDDARLWDSSIGPHLWLEYAANLAADRGLDLGEAIEDWCAERLETGEIVRNVTMDHDEEFPGLCAYLDARPMTQDEIADLAVYCTMSEFLLP